MSEHLTTTAGDDQLTIRFLLVWVYSHITILNFIVYKRFAFFPVRTFFRST